MLGALDIVDVEIEEVSVVTLLSLRRSAASGLWASLCGRFMLS